MNRKWDWKWLENGPKMATVNNPNILGRFELAFRAAQIQLSRYSCREISRLVFIGSYFSMYNRLFTKYIYICFFVNGPGSTLAWPLDSVHTILIVFLCSLYFNSKILRFLTPEELGHAVQSSGPLAQVHHLGSDGESHSHPLMSYVTNQLLWLLVTAYLLLSLLKCQSLANDLVLPINRCRRSSHG